MTHLNAVVTGAGSGIGLSLTEALLRRDVAVLALDLDLSALPDSHPRLRKVDIDVRDWDAISALALEGDEPIHYLFANAGVGAPGSVLTSAVSQWQWAWDVNVMGPLHLLRSWWPRLERGRGHAVATVSSAALQSYPGASLYRATKAALLSALEGLYYETRAGGAQLHALCPGLVKTRIVDTQRYADAAPPPTGAAPNPFVQWLQSMMASAETADSFAQRVLDALPSNPPFYWFTHPETLGWIEGRHRAIIDTGMPFADFGVPQ